MTPRPRIGRGEPTVAISDAISASDASAVLFKTSIERIAEIISHDVNLDTAMTWFYSTLIAYFLIWAQG